MGWDFNFAMLTYDQWWRRHRRVFHEHFHPNADTTWSRFGRSMRLLNAFSKHQGALDNISGSKVIVGIWKISGIDATRTRSRRLPFVVRAPPFCSPLAMFCSARCSPNEHRESSFLFSYDSSPCPTSPCTYDRTYISHDRPSSSPQLFAVVNH